MTETIIPVTPSGVGPDLSQWAYAGFWRRFWALSVDAILLFLALVIIAVPVGVVMGIGQLVVWPISMNMMDLQYQMMSPLCFKIQVITWLYFALMESSSWQATVGKRLFGLRVMTVGGQRLSFWRATGRYFAKYISTVIWLIGFIMAAFTARKQALHDLIAETLVMRER